VFNILNKSFKKASEYSGEGINYQEKIFFIKIFV